MLCWLCDCSIKACIKVYLLTMLLRRCSKELTDSPAGQSATLSRCRDRRASFDIIMFLWLLGWCIQLYCSVDSLQESWPAGCASVISSSQATHAEREIELRLFGILLYSHSSALGRLPEMLRKSAGELEMVWEEAELQWLCFVFIILTFLQR